MCTFAILPLRWPSRESVLWLRIVKTGTIRHKVPETCVTLNQWPAHYLAPKCRSTTSRTLICFYTIRLLLKTVLLMLLEFVLFADCISVCDMNLSLDICLNTFHLSNVVSNTKLKTEVKRQKQEAETWNGTL